MDQLKTFFYSFKKSLTKPEYYKDVAKTSFGFSFKYLWFLFFLITIIRTITFGYAYLKFRPEIKPWINQAMAKAQILYPSELELKINNGQLSTNVEEPYIYGYESGKRSFIVIDTQGSIENYPNYNTYVLATRNAVVYPSKSRNNQIEQTSVYYFKDLKQNFTLNQKVYDDLLNKLKPFLPRIPFFIDLAVAVVLFLFLFFGSLFITFGEMFRLLIWNFVIWIINLIFKKGYSYGSLYKMSMHAITLELIVAEIGKYTVVRLPYALIYFLWMLVILFTIKEASTTVLLKKTSIKKRA